jgi:bleomycin hydrolase
MHIIGLAKDQNVKESYIVKNSWGESNDYKGYLFMTKEYVKLKSTAIMVHKAAVPSDLAKKMSI